MDIREKLIELLHVSVCDYNCDKCEYSVSDEVCIRHLEEMAADYLIANGVRVQQCGEWVYDHWCEFKCSVCGEFSNSKPYKGTENYCSNCGAKMMPWSPKGELVDEA